MIPHKRPWDGKARVRMIHYFGASENPTQLAALKREESRLYVQEEFMRLYDSDRKRESQCPSMTQT